jgi:hypothetical protein
MEIEEVQKPGSCKWNKSAASSTKNAFGKGLCLKYTVLIVAQDLKYRVIEKDGRDLKPL